ncbi:MAG: L,D-transpeptidase family protein [Turicibacter sp.]|nr:L,D-transpeptidase family protein [Turicibacter sp.]
MGQQLGASLTKYTVQNLDLRKEPAKSAMIITVIPPYSCFEVLDSDDEWFKVLYETRIGYIYKEEASITKVTTGNVHLRAKPSKKSISMKIIKKHHEVEVVAHDGLWDQVFYEGKLGFICGEYLSDDGMEVKSDKLEPFYDDTEKYLNHQKIKSSTAFLLCTNLKAKQTFVFEEQKGSWKELYRWSCTIGASDSPTIVGAFQVMGRKELLETERYQAKYATRVREGYYYHSLLYDSKGVKVIDDRLGGAFSHGSIRLPEEGAKWIYDHLLEGTTVLIY